MRVWVHLDVTRDLRSSGVAVLGAGRCPSVHDKSLLSTALFPLTTKEKMEADQRSIYVGNVSGSPCSVPAGCVSQIPGVDLPLPKAWLFHPRCFSCAQPSLGTWLVICHLQLTCCRCQLLKSPLEAVGCVVFLVPSKQGRLSVGFVFQVGALRAGRVP